jgi:hypothetical protein
MLVPITFPPDQVFPAKAFATLYIPMAIDHLNLILQLSVNHNRKWWRLYSPVIIVRSSGRIRWNTLWIFRLAGNSSRYATSPILLRILKGPMNFGSSFPTPYFAESDILRGEQDGCSLVILSLLPLAIIIVLLALLSTLGCWL